MVIVKIKSKKHAFTIPVPYCILRMGASILTSKLIHRIMEDWLNKHSGHAAGDLNRQRDYVADSSLIWIELVLNIIENRSIKQVVRLLIKELQHCKGTVLVDVKAQDGTGVLIKL